MFRHNRILRQLLNLLGQILQHIPVEFIALQGNLFCIVNEFFAGRLVPLRALFPALLGNTQLIAHDAQHLIDFAGRQRRQFRQILIQHVNLLDSLHLFTHGVTAPDQIKHLIQDRLYLTRITLDCRAQLLVYATE